VLLAPIYWQTRDPSNEKHLPPPPDGALCAGALSLSGRSLSARCRSGLAWHTPFDPSTCPSSQVILTQWSPVAR
jgi:hypothetical protein